MKRRGFFRCALALLGLQFIKDGPDRSLEPTIHLQHRMSWDKAWSFRLVVPGVDGGGAVWLESEIDRDSHLEALRLLRKVSEATGIRADICECQEEDWARVTSSWELTEYG